MIDLDRIIREAVKSRKIYFGSKRTINAARNGKAAIIITSSKCPDVIKRDIQHHARISGIPLYIYNGSSQDLGLVCGKKFSVSALVVREITKPELLKMVNGKV